MLKASPPPKIVINSELVNQFLGGLKLKELKEAITKNSEFVIDFKALQL